jgi:predicted transcriptional regulator
MYTNEIAVELRRDKEFVKSLLLEMHKEGYVEEVSKNKKGHSYQTRKRWRIPKQVLEKLNQVYNK